MLWTSVVLGTGTCLLPVVPRRYVWMLLTRYRDVLAACRAEQIWIDCSLLIVLVTRQRGVAEVC